MVFPFLDNPVDLLQKMLMPFVCSSGNGPRIAKVCILLLALWCAIDVPREANIMPEIGDHHNTYHFHLTFGMLLRLRKNNELQKQTFCGSRSQLTETERSPGGTRRSGASVQDLISMSHLHISYTDRSMQKTWIRKIGYNLPAHTVVLGACFNARVSPRRAGKKANGQMDGKPQNRVTGRICYFRKSEERYP